MNTLNADLRLYHGYVEDMAQVMHRLDDTLCMDPDSALSSAVEGLIEGYQSALDAHYPGIYSWLDWWRDSCRLGERPRLVITSAGEERLIATIDDLVAFLRIELGGDTHAG